MKREVFFGVLGQLINSATNLGLQLTLIAYATKAEYGWYVLVMSYFFLGLGIQNAILTTPLSVVLGKEDAASKKKAIEILGFWVAASAICMGLLIELTFSNLTFEGFHSEIAVGLAFGSFWIKEFYRAVAYSVGRVKKSAFLDLTAAAVILLYFLLLVHENKTVTANQIFFGVGIINFISILPWLVDYRPRAGRVKQYAEIMGHARWALPGVLVIWIQNNSYLSVANIFWGPKLVADLGASRLCIMPMATVFSGWSKVFLNKAASWIAGGSYKNIEATMITVNKVIFFGHIVAVFAYWVFSNTWLYSYLPVTYQGLDTYIYLWLLFSAVALTRGVATQAIQAFADFSRIFKLTFMSVVLTALSIATAITLQQSYMLILALILGEVFVYLMVRNDLQKKLT